MSQDFIQIPVELDVYEYLKGKSTFEDTPSTVLRRELRLPSLANGATDDDEDPASWVAGEEATFDPGLSRLGSPSRTLVAERPKTRKNSKTKRSRAAAGTLLPESEYHRPILEILSDHGGSAPKQVVIDEVGKRLADRLTEVDRDELDSGGIRWQSRTQFARLRLADRGLIDKNAPRGTWAITPEATKALAKGTV